MELRLLILKKKSTLHAHFQPARLLIFLDFFLPPLLVFGSYVLAFPKKSHPLRLFQPPVITEVIVSFSRSAD